MDLDEEEEGGSEEGSDDNESGSEQNSSEGNSEEEEEDYATSARLLQENDDNEEEEAPSNKEILYCSMCSISFDDKLEYGQHLNKYCVELENVEENGNDAAAAAALPVDHGYTCLTCQVKFTTKVRFIRHMSMAPHNNPEFDWMLKMPFSSNAPSSDREYFCPAHKEIKTISPKEKHHAHLLEIHYDEMVT